MAEPHDEVVDQPAERPFDASDPEQVNQRKRDAGRRKKDARLVMATLMSSPAGRTWVWELLSAANIFRTSFVAGDPCATAFAEGSRNVGLRLLAEISSVAPDMLVLMMKERGNG